MDWVVPSGAACRQTLLVTGSNGARTCRYPASGIYQQFPRNAAAAVLRCSAIDLEFKTKIKKIIGKV